MNKKLTIVITSYNRKDALIKQLQSIEQQGQFDKYEIIISDNHSNYDLEELIKPLFSSDFFSLITIFKRPINIGGAANIALSFQLVSTPWMWLLSDDDITLPTSIHSILNDINNYPNICWFKYSIGGGFNKYPDSVCTSCLEVFKMHSEGTHSFGEFVFMCNNVYNMKLIKPYIGKLPFLITTCYSQVLAPLYAIKQDNCKMMFKSTPLIQWTPGRMSYKLYYAYSNYPNFVYSDFQFSKSEMQYFHKMFDIKYKALLFSLIEIKEKWVRDEIYHKYKAFYLRNSLIKRCVFSCIYYLGMPFLEMYVEKRKN